MKLNTKVFIDGLPYQDEPSGSGKLSLEEELMQFAATWKVGKPLRLIKKPGQGFGFLVFKSPHSVDTAVRVMNGRKFLGRVLRVEAPKARGIDDAGLGGSPSFGAAHPSSQTHPSGDGGGPLHAHAASPYQQQLHDARSTYPRQVLLSDLPKGTQPDMLREVLRDIAPLLEAKMAAIKMTSNNRKAFLTCDSEEDAATAVKFLDGLKLLGRTVAATRAAPPGTLPFSPVPHRAVGLSSASSNGRGDPVGHRGREEDAEAEEAGHHEKKTRNEEEEEEEEDDRLVPLGLMPDERRKNKTEKKDIEERRGKKSSVEERNGKSTTRLQANRAEDRFSSGSEMAASVGLTPSGKANLTGKTKRYNLLDDGPTEVHVGNLSDQITEAQVRQHFARCGNIRSCELLVNPHTFAFTGIAKLNFSLPAYAAYAQQHLNGSRLGESTIQVDRG